MASGTTYCVCGQPYDPRQFMIQCDSCREWYHGSCVKVQEVISKELDRYHCPACAPTFGPSRCKPRTNWHRQNASEPDAENKPVQTGTPVFVDELKSRHFAVPDDIIIHLPGEQLTVQYLQEHGFERPILINTPEGLDMSVPSDDFTVRDVAHFIGPDREVDVIDVTRQADVRMKLQDFVDYYLNPQRLKILNVISLEFTNTRLATIVEAPYIARKLDWVNYVWPEELPETAAFQKPEVQKYCLMGVKDSYTDFHVDFGGSSVWYHILKGEKIFYLIKPTPANLSLYQRWMTSSSRSETFFGDQVDECYKCVMQEGQTMMIPTGWIHAVLTPIDSLVFGGNFLHSLNIPMQLQIYEIEKKIRTPGKFCFPAFETTNWYAARALLEEMRELNNQGRMLPSYLLIGVKALILTLKQWNQDKDFNKSRREQIPEDIEGPKLLKDLSKEVRHAERFLNSLNPPKPERESKRKKKKPVNADFVDFTEPQNMADPYDTPAPLKLTIRTVPKTVRKAAASPSVPSRPPLKLTLPKPATYPYSTNVLADEANNKNLKQENAVLSENIDKIPKKPWSSLLGDQSLLKNKHNELKLSSKNAGHPVKNESIYDFHDESDDEKMVFPKSRLGGDDGNDDDDDSGDRLMIDEKPKKRIAKINPFRMKMALISEGPKNGIDELLKASGYTVGDAGDPNMRLDDIESVQASPSTKEAIAGMLSMSMSIGDTNSSEDSSPKSRSKRAQFSDDYGENIDKVHQDEDYIYPTLDASDDEDVIFKPRGRRKLDEAWSPKARVGPLVPKTDRPTREGTKKQSVEKGLEAAAAKRAGLPAPKRPYNRKKIRPPNEILAAPSVSSGEAPSPKKLDPKLRKPRKGMATPKQRLGKILKIHKMKF
ncbi:hypothetical protein R5R35_008260 [Gryllus longicercus]|uniref:Uncharacterized protein n=1 Tax=Gryllus longicercus TaxID=2509291 RepID=A0AAN9VTJ1_9ORTH